MKMTIGRTFLVCLMLTTAFSIFWVASSADARKQDASSRRVESAGSALERAILQGDQNPTVQTQAKVGKAHRLFQDLVNARVNEILKRLKQLESKIESPKNNDVTDSENFLQASAAAFEKSGVKEEYLALEQELAGLYDSMEEFSRGVAGFQIQAVSVGPACPPASITNTLGGTSADFPSTTGQLSDRLIQNGVQSTCAAQKVCPGTTDPGTRVFDQYQFTNSGCTTACVTVTLTIGAGGCGSTLLPVAYLTSFNPAALCTNYLGEPGQSALSGTPVTFSVNVPPKTGFVIVVYEVSAGAGGGCPYILNLSGLCQACEITCPGNITMSNDPNQCAAVVNYPAPTACGDCGTVTCSPASTSSFPVGITTVTCTTTAGPSCSFTVTVNDTQAPSITCPTDVTTTTATVNDPCVVVTFPPPTASDNCPGVTTLCTPASGSCFKVGTTTVTCTATDASGNTATCSFDVSVFNVCLQDDSNPTIVFLGNSITGEYRFCCGGTSFTGVAQVTKRGSIATFQHYAPTQRVLATADGGVFKGTASLQFPPGSIKCTIQDRDTRNNSCVCQ